MLEALQVFLVIYCALLALLAPLGFHRPLLVYPARAVYALVALVLLLLSFGRLQIETPVIGVWRKGKRGFRSSFRDWRREKEEERIIWSSSGSGDNPLQFLKDQDKKKGD